MKSPFEWAYIRPDIYENEFPGGTKIVPALQRGNAAGDAPTSRTDGEIIMPEAASESLKSLKETAFAGAGHAREYTLKKTALDIDFQEIKR